MTFEEVLDQALAMLQRRGRVTYRTLQRQFQLDEDALNDLKDALLYAHPEVHDDAGRGLVWTGAPDTAPPVAPSPASPQERAPLAYTPAHLAEQILAARSTLAGERKQVTVLFADLQGSTELIADLDPEAAQRLLDPALHCMMDAVHRYEGTVNQVLGDGIMALFGAPVAHEDHAVRACYAALAMQAALRRYGEEVRHTHGLEVQIRVGLHSGEVAAQRQPPDVAQAEAHYQQALALAEALGMRPLQAHCHLGLGTLYAKAGWHEQARAALSVAIELYRTMEMTFWLPRAEAALAQAGGGGVGGTIPF
jgi:tetratricopeptide (TPR) repeat protein